MNEPIHLAYTLTYKEWLEVHAAVGRKARRRMFVFLLVLFGVFAVGVVRRYGAEVHARQATTSPSEELPPLESIVIMLIPWIVIMSAAFFLSRWMRRAGWKRNSLAQRMYSLDVDVDCVLLSSGVETTRWRWEAFIGSEETANLMILRLGPKTVLPIPKRAANTAQLEQLRQIVRERAVPRSGGFPVQPLGPGGR